MSRKIKKIFICSPLRGDWYANRKRAEKYCRIVLEKGYLPLAPHVYFTRFMDDNIREERILALKFCIELLKMCDEIWVFSENNTITEGMQKEINYAKKHHIKIVYKFCGR